MPTQFLSARRGATAIQYGLIAALVSLAMAAALPNLGGKLSASLCTVSGGLNGSSGCGASGGSPTPASLTTMATCKAAGFVWDGTYCDSPAHAAIMAKTIVDFFNGTNYPASGCTWGCNAGFISFSNGSVIISAYTIGGSQGNIADAPMCASFGGSFSPTGGNWGQGTCTVPNASATAAGCLTLGGHQTASGGCDNSSGRAYLNYGSASTYVTPNCLALGGTMVGSSCRFP